MDQVAFLHKLQSADEPTKRRWIAVFTTAVMTIVIFLWLAYFNNFVENAGRPETREAVPESAKENFTFTESFKGRAAAIYNYFADKLESFTAPRSYIITPEK